MFPSSLGISHRRSLDELLVFKGGEPFSRVFAQALVRSTIHASDRQQSRLLRLSDDDKLKGPRHKKRGEDSRLSARLGNTDSYTTTFSEGKMSTTDKVLKEFHDLMQELQEGGSDGGEELSCLDTLESLQEEGSIFVGAAKLDSPANVGEDSVSEADVLRRNNVSLLEALNEERRLRSKAERALLLAKDEAECIRVERDAEVEGYRLASVRLQNQVRCLCEEAGMDEVYGMFEAEVSRQTRELEALRRRNVQLETRDLVVLATPSSVAEQSFSSAVAVASIDAVTSPPFSGYNSRESKRLLYRLRQKASDVEQLTKENERLRAAERSHAFATRQARDSTRRINLAAQSSNRHRTMFETEQGEHNKTKSSLVVAQQEANALEEECRRQRREIETLKSEIAHLTKRIVDTEAKFKQVAKVATFIKKHKGGVFR